MTPWILIVENDTAFAEELEGTLKELGYEIAGRVASGEEAIQVAGEWGPDLVLMDISLSGSMDGIEASEKIQCRFSIPVVYLTGHAEEETLQRAKKTEPYGYLQKPASPTELRNTIETALYKYEADKRVKDSEKRYRSLVELSPHGITEIGPHGKLVSVNPAYCRLLGYSRQELLGKSVVDLESSEERKEELRNYLEHLVKDQPPPVPWFAGSVAKDGRVVNLQIDWDYKRDDRGGVVGFISIVTDITERKRAEAELKQAKEDWERTFDAVSDLIMILDDKQRIVRLNRAAAELLGKTADQAVGTFCFQFVHGTDTCPPLCPFQKLSQTCANQSAEVVDEGSGKTFDITVSPIIDPNGELIGCVHVARDITHRKSAEKILRESELRFRQLAENIQEVFWLLELGPPERLVYVSPTYERIWGRSRDEIYADTRSWTKAIVEEDRERVKVALRWFLRGEDDSTTELDYRIVRPDGSIRWIRDRAFAITDENGKPYRVAGLAQDLTQQREDRKRQAELVDEIKHFAYIVSHDLRAPLSNLSGFSAELELAMGVIRNGMEIAPEDLSEERKSQIRAALEEDIPESLEFIKSSVSRMNHLINAILRLSRLGHTELSLTRLDMNKLVAEVVNSFAHQISQKGAEVSIETLPEIVADRTSMEQIIGNLLDNAVKYLDPDRPGLIKISGWSDGGEKVFRLQDNGKGIEAKDLERIFQVFQRSGKQDVPGEGMGLAYVRTLARRHGGRIWCESEPGAGSIFTFTISAELSEGEVAG